MEQTGQNPQTILSQFDRVVQMRPNWDKGYFALGKYYDTLLQACLQQNDPSQCSMIEQYEAKYLKKTEIPKHVKYYKLVITNYLKSLQHSHTYIYQSLPRLITLWSKSTNELQKDKAQKNKTIFAEQFEITKLMSTAQKTLAPYQWMCCFNQIMSHICSFEDENLLTIKAIIDRVTQSFRQQCFWAIEAVSKSSNSNRCNRARDIIGALSKGKEMSQFLKTAHDLCATLLKLCNHPMRESVANSEIMRGLRDSCPLNIIVPIQSSLTLTLPSTNSVGSEPINPFGPDLPMIQSFRTEVEIMPSLQRPKKITAVGSDGQNYIFLCKPKDDMRKDARVMEFNNILNKLLKKNPDSRKRNLLIRTYAVTPLNEECGIIEWVKNSLCYRNVIFDLYNKHGLTVPTVCVSFSPFPLISLSLYLSISSFDALMIQHPIWPCCNKWGSPLWYHDCLVVTSMH